MTMLSWCRKSVTLLAPQAWVEGKTNCRTPDFQFLPFQLNLDRLHFWVFVRLVSLLQNWEIRDVQGILGIEMDKPSNILRSHWPWSWLSLPWLSWSWLSWSWLSWSWLSWWLYCYLCICVQKLTFVLKSYHKIVAI